MPDRKPEPWESDAAGPFLWIEGSAVEVWALGENASGSRRRARAARHGFDEAEQAVDALAEQLG